MYLIICGRVAMYLNTSGVGRQYLHCIHTRTFIGGRGGSVELGYTYKRAGKGVFDNCTQRKLAGGSKHRKGQCPPPSSSPVRHKQNMHMTKSNL